MNLYTHNDMAAMGKGMLPERPQSYRVTAENISLHFDEQGTLWVLPSDETIHLLDYRTVENYHICDFDDRDLEALADVYYGKSLEPVKQRWYAVHLIRNLRSICAREKTPGYAEQLNRVGVL